MWISNSAIRKPVVTTVIVLALVIFGTLSLAILDTDEFPEVQPPIINVSIPYPGASPRTVERELVDPVEEAIASISGVDEIESVAMDGFATITVTFLFDKDLDQASQDIRDAISEIRNDLPDEIEEPVLTRFDPNELPILSLTLSSPTLSPTQLTRLADPGITGELRGIPGVAEAEMVGGIERQLTVELDPDAMRAARIGVVEVVRALEAANLAAPVGRLSGRLDERTIRLQARPEGPDDFRALVVAHDETGIVRLGDIARVRDGTEEPRTTALFDGEPAVGIDVIKTTGASTTAVADRIRERIRELRGELPESVEVSIVRDAGVRVERSVGDVQVHLLEGAALTVLVVFVFLTSWRSTVITGLALPTSVLASFIAVWAFGFTLNTMTLLGLTLAIGILIDDAIVVRENIVRHMEMGKDHVTAAREGTSEIGLAVSATTLSIVVVFVPVAFMGGIAQQWLAPFALTVACAVLVSLFVSFSLDPMLSALWPDPEARGDRRTWLARRLGRFNAWFDRQTERYKRLIAWALRHRLAIVAITLASFAGAAALPALGVIGSEFFPRQDRSEFTIEIETPPGSSLEYTLEKASEASRIARRRPEVDYTYTTVGGEGEAVDVAEVYVRLVPKSERAAGQHAIAAALRDRIGRISGADVWLSTGGFEAERQIQLEVSGPELDRLTRLAERVAAEVEKVPGAVDVGLSTKGLKPEVEVAIDRELAATLGVTVNQIAAALRPAFASVDAGDWIDPTGEMRDVEVRLLPRERTRPADIADLPLALPPRPGASTAAGGAAGARPPEVIPLGQVVSIDEAIGPAQITRVDRERVVTVGANTEDRPLSEVVAGIDRRLQAVQLPAGYDIAKGGETEEQQDVFGRMLVVLGVAVVLMYLVLVIQFGSFFDPIPIMISLPLSLIGVMLALLVTGSTLNLMSMIGVILLIGIVAKNAILLIDFAKWSDTSASGRKAAIIEAGGVRLRPILMTSLAIIAGMLPVAIGHGEGAEFRAPLGRAVIGGVIASTVLTLLVIPTFYDILAGWRDRLLARVHRRSGRRGARAQGPE